MQKEIELDQAHIFKTHILKVDISATNKDHFEHTNHNIFLNFLFQNEYKLFSRECNLHRKYLPCLGDSQNLLSLVMMLH